MKRSTVKARNQARRRARRELRQRRRQAGFKRGRLTALERWGFSRLAVMARRAFAKLAGGDDRPRVFRGRCPICVRNIARATIGKVALEKLTTHGRRRGSSHGARDRLPSLRPCPGSGMAPIR